MKLKIAVVQLGIEQYSPKNNLPRAEGYIRKASLKKADLIVFPEDFITGPLVGKREFADSKKAYLELFRNFARKYHIDIVPGSFIEEDKFGLHNTTYYIESNGKAKARYRKVNLWHPERNYLNPGNEVPVFETRFGKVGLVICWDLIFPEIFRRMIQKGVEIVICPSYWCCGDAGAGIKFENTSEIKAVDSLCVSRAFENEIIFVYCNAAGKLDLGNFQDTLIGHSQITVPFKGAIKKLEHNKEEMFIQEVDTAILEDAERSYKIREDLNNRVLS